MTEPDPMLQEMTQVHNSMSITAARTKDEFDIRMRATVKDIVGTRYASEGKPTEVAPEIREFTQILENADIFSDMLFGGDNSKRRQFMKSAAEWNRTRPVRIYNYVQKLVDIFPAEHLTHLLRTSLNHTPEETISLYEANKGEAESSDYSGEPTGIDPTAFRSTAKLVRKI